MINVYVGHTRNLLIYMYDLHYKLYIYIYMIYPRCSSMKTFFLLFIVNTTETFLLYRSKLMGYNFTVTYILCRKEKNTNIFIPCIFLFNEETIYQIYCCWFVFLRMDFSEQFSIKGKPWDVRCDETSILIVCWLKDFTVMLI